MVGAGRQSYPDRTILLYNLQRVLDKGLATEQRAASLELVNRLNGGEDPMVLGQLAGVLADPQLPEQLHRAMLKFLLSKDYPELAGYIVNLIAQSDQGDGLENTLRNWLLRHPSSEVLAEVVKLWAQQLSQGRDETSFVQIVEQIANRPWSEALLEAINTPGFYARGSAWEVLVGKLDSEQLARKLAAMPARTDALNALRVFSEKFGYMPRTGQELLSMVSVLSEHPEAVDAAAGMSRRWRRDYGYQFNIRDFHLLSRLAAHPAGGLSRAELVSRVSARLMKRRHVRHWVARNAPEDPSVFFSKLAERLTMADLWNLYLLDEMLSRRQVRAALRVLADRDRADTRNAWGGLIFLENGRAEAKLYRADPAASAEDQFYVGPSRVQVEGRNALCHFGAHFARAYNARQAGPGPKEMRRAREGNFYGLVLTSLGERTFTAHYYNPDGVVVSLGVFSFAS